MSSTRRGLLLVLSAPSGTGKGTLVKLLLAAEQGLSLSTSVTTRAPRPGERDGHDYHFVTPERFEAMAQAGDLAEYATVHGNGYGTPRGALLERLAAGSDVVLEIDWQGGYQLREKLGTDAVTVFILPPSPEELRRRLLSRNSDAPEVIEKRLAAAATETERGMAYDYITVNDNLEHCLQDLQAILRAERLKRHPRT